MLRTMAAALRMNTSGPAGASAATACASCRLPSHKLVTRARSHTTGATAAGVPTGPAGGYNDPEECAIADESQQQLEQDRQSAERLALQGGVGGLSEGQLAAALARESREAAAEHQEDAWGPMPKGDTLSEGSIVDDAEQH